MKSILFIINPISGKKKKDFLVDKIATLFDSSRFRVEVRFTERAGHGIELAMDAVRRKMDVVVAVGGDGTINEVASQLVNTDTALAIVPLGSGNGLARHLSIPLNPENALKLIAQRTDAPDSVDACKINHRLFFSVAGVGYDAKIAYDFNHGTERGFMGYLKQAVKNYFSYGCQSYVISADGTSFERNAFFITFANSAQWGYDVKIQPKASVKDGLLDVCVAKKPHILALGVMAVSLLLNRIDRRSLIEYSHCKILTIRMKDNKKMYWHVDGDSEEPVDEIRIEMLPHSLKVVCGE